MDHLKSPPNLKSNLFSDFNLVQTLKDTLTEKKLTKMTDIQSQSIPALLAGRSVVGVSETGSGKTLAYVLPILQILKTLELQKNPVVIEGQPRAAVIVPTRELGEQVSRVFKMFTHTTRLRVRNVLGGSTAASTKQNIAAPFEVLVATPGRLIQMLDQELINLCDNRILIFDEADQMLDGGFLPDAERIARESARQLQLGLFSATVSKSTQELISSLFSKAEIIHSSNSQVMGSAKSVKTVKSLSTKNLTVPEGKRYPLMEKILREKNEGSTLIFVNTRTQCDILFELMKKSGFECLCYRGEMDKVERRMNLKLFRDGKIKFLISTDLASRGLDVDHIDRVINYHLPQQIENYLHRVGRTARAGRAGQVINLVTHRDKALISRLENKNG
jgi:ATP-dependent RNA helicase RhlE